MTAQSDRIMNSNYNSAKVSPLLISINNNNKVL